jgi:hypothetical protein
MALEEHLPQVTGPGRLPGGEWDNFGGFSEDEQELTRSEEVCGGGPRERKTLTNCVCLCPYHEAIM